MPPCYARILLAFLLVTAMLDASIARALGEPQLPGLPQVVRNGGRIDIAWSGLPAGTREVELEVSIEGGPWKRISPELEAHQGHYIWRIPAHFVGSARMHLLFGSDHGESYSAPSEPFEIEGIGPPGPAHLCEDDRWTSRGGFGRWMPGQLADAAPHLKVLLVGFHAELPPRSSAEIPALRSAASPVQVMRVAQASPLGRPRAARVFTPLRN
ncbi:MAG: hypothetical protein ABIU54_02270 [Candidatus Eisenbacteria bacterium]